MLNKLLNIKVKFLFMVLVVVGTLPSCEKNLGLLPIENEEVNKEAENEQEQEEVIPRLTQRNKEGILTYFDELIRAKKVLVGQHCGDGPDQVKSYFDIYVEGLAQRTGKYVSMIGGDLGWYQSESYPVDKLVGHWNAGGLVTLSWHADNPFTAGYEVRLNSVNENDKIDFKKLLRSAAASEAKASYRNEVDLVAKALRKLKDAGVTVIWRPLHEMNGDFFWWGINEYNNQQSNVNDFKLLWKDLYETLVFDYALDNLIWVYSAIPSLGWNGNSTAYYPGDAFVDLVGVDYYGEEPDYPDYNDFKALGKTMVLCEAGPIGNGYGRWDEMDLVNKIKGKAAYFLQWHSWTNAEVAIKDNLNASKMMNSAEAITLDEL